MFQIKKTSQNTLYNNQLFFNSILGKINIFFIDKSFNISENIKITQTKKNIFMVNNSIISNLNNLDIFILLKKQDILFLIIIIKKKKKQYLNLYKKIIISKLKGLTHKFKSSLFLTGIGFKTLIKESYLIFKLGFSHEVKIKIPYNIKVTHKANRIMFSSENHQKLTQYVSFIQFFKKPEPYKGKGFLLTNQKIKLKEGKTGKK